MNSPPNTQNQRSGHITRKMRHAVFWKYGHHCYYPGCRLKIDTDNYLCIHDITHTGQHDKIRFLRPLCRIHHNQATNENKHAKAVIRKFQQHLKPINVAPGVLFAEAFYGSPERD